MHQGITCSKFTARPSQDNLKIELVISRNTTQAAKFDLGQSAQPLANPWFSDTAAVHACTPPAWRSWVPSRCCRRISRYSGWKQSRIWWMTFIRGVLVPFLLSCILQRCQWPQSELLAPYGTPAGTIGQYWATEEMLSSVQTYILLCLLLGSQTCRCGTSGRSSASVQNGTFEDPAAAAPTKPSLCSPVVTSPDVPLQNPQSAPCCAGVWCVLWWLQLQAQALSCLPSQNETPRPTSLHAWFYDFVYD